MASKRRICILADGYLDLFTAKTAVGLLRYCPDEVVAVIDHQHAGEDLETILGVGQGIPIVKSVSAAATLRPDHLAIGVALPGGVLPDNWRRMISEALSAGMDVVNGLHQQLGRDSEIADCAARAGRRIHDVRQPPANLAVGRCRALRTRARRILTIGTDANVGKRVTALEIVSDLNRRGVQAEFVATGQTGIMIGQSGVVLDAVPSDFVSGTIEQAVLDRADADFVVVEGQGALTHPGFSAVTLGLLHGVLPDFMVLCHAVSRQTMRASDVAVVGLTEMIRLTEYILAPLHTGRVIAVALNCHGLSDDAANTALEEAGRLTGLPVADPIRTGAGPIVDAICSE